MVPTRALEHRTTLKLLYDDTMLYVAFQCEDSDITDRYQHRDDPIYEHEAVELFLMPGTKPPEVGPYVELQASPKGVIFDAAFSGPRTGMDVDFNAGQTIGTILDGTLNKQDRDRGWVSEWAVPWVKIRGIKHPPKPGERWRMNAFRIDRFRKGGQLRAEYTAWSPPLVGDFHELSRFGTIGFGKN